MAEQAQVPIFDYPVLSDHRVNAGRDLAEAEPGQRVFGDEDVRLETGDFEPGDDDLGSVTVEENRTTRPGQVLFRAVFDFVDKKGPIVVTGSCRVRGFGTASPWRRSRTRAPRRRPGRGPQPSAG